MADPSSGIPADGISFDKAFELVLDAMRQEGRVLPAEIDADEFYMRSDATWRDADTFLRDELAHGALTAYCCHPIRGIEQVHTRYWMTPALVWGDADGSIFFHPAEFRSWFDACFPKIREQKTRMKGSPAFDQAKRALVAMFGAEIPDASKLRNKQLCQQVHHWFAEQIPPPQNISDDTILRAAGRK